MKFEFYNIEKYDCIIRTLTKLIKESPIDIKNDLISLAKNLNKENYNEIEVFEKYLELNNFNKINNLYEKINNLDNMIGKYAIFCRRDDYYHMIPIIDNVIYDKNYDIFEFDVINIYKKED